MHDSEIGMIQTALDEATRRRDLRCTGSAWGLEVANDGQASKKIDPLACPICPVHKIWVSTSSSKPNIIQVILTLLVSQRSKYRTTELFTAQTKSERR